ncbi:hypothetical protein F4781DRAFT_379553 [Annulohypoxylon bovei var. microspora]|nr:hypothetical protein F4781DRAFT_379553 [Annulohypoxylon bovei var. microspora]
MSLSQLPCETLSLILEFLADEDLAALLIAQRVCKRFRAAIEHILTHYSLSTHQTACLGLDSINPVFWRPFGGIICTVAERREGRLENRWGQFRNLPWVKGSCTGKGEGEGERGGEGEGEGMEKVVRNKDMRGNPYLRPDASWRRLSMTWGVNPGIRRLDVVKTLTVYGGTSMTYKQLEIPPHPPSDGDGGGGGEAGEGVLTMGLFYDLMASGEGGLGRSTMGWRLLPGRRLSSYDGWLGLKARSQYPSGDAVMSLFVDDPASAVLYVTGHRGCTMNFMMCKKGKDEDEGEKIWEPHAIGGIPVVLRPWQGPVNRKRT